MKLTAMVLVAGLALSGAAMAQQKAQQNPPAQQMQQMRSNFDKSKQDLQKMKADAQKEKDPVLRDYMNQNNQMWDDTLANELHMGKVARDMKQQQKQK